MQSPTPEIQAPAFVQDDARDAGAGLGEHTVRYLSQSKGEPAWLLEQRLQALHACMEGDRTTPWAPTALAEIPWEALHYYRAPRSGRRPGEANNPATLARTLDAFGIAQDGDSLLAGAQAQVDGEVVHASLQKEWEREGVIFVDSTRGLTEFGDTFRPHFGRTVGRDENLFTKLNSAVFSGGSFVYVPAGVKITAPLKCFMHLQGGGSSQFGRTLIVAEEDAEVTFFENCTSAARPGAALHCAVGEFILGRNARLNYIALQNWQPSVFNLAVLRARLAAGASIHWIDCNLGGRLTMKYPCALLEGEGASAEAVSITVAHSGQHHDSGAKMFHRAPGTTSTITSKNVCCGTGHTQFRGWVDIPASVHGCRNHTACDSLLIDSTSRTTSIPTIQVRGRGNSAQHEASVSKLDAEQLFYMRQRGLSEGTARSLSVNGFVNDLVQRFPLQYSLEIKKLIELEMAASVG